jgi:ABC-2 type transport system ATP-binding protein
VDGLYRYRGAVEAVAGIDLEVPRGAVFGFLGPNGAGKTTTIEVLCTLLAPTAGRAEVAGQDVVRRPHEVRRRIGVVFQEPTLDQDLRVGENLRFHADLFGLPRTTTPESTREVLALVGMADHGAVPVRHLSGGMRRRVEIARGLLHTPDVLFLDEPTTGLDPQTRLAVWDQLCALRDRRGVTVFLTTHHLEEAEHCDLIAIIDHGRLVAQGTPAALKAVVADDLVVVRTDDDTAAAAARIRDRWGWEASVADGVRFRVADGAGVVPAVCAGLGLPVRSITVTPPTLDDVFVHHTGRAIRDDVTVRQSVDSLGGA